MKEKGKSTSGKKLINTNTRIFGFARYAILFSAFITLFAFFYNFSQFNVFEWALLVFGLIWLISAVAVRETSNKNLLMIIAVICIVSGVAGLAIFIPTF